MKAGINLIDAVRSARRLGILVEHLRKTGELRWSHPSAQKPIRVNSRRKDAPRHATTFLRKVAAAQATKGCKGCPMSCVSRSARAETAIAESRQPGAVGEQEQQSIHARSGSGRFTSVSRQPRKEG